MKTIRYTNSEHTQILIEPEGWQLGLPLPKHRQEILDEWIVLGNIIEVYSEFDTLTKADTFIVKRNQIEEQAQTLIESAYVLTEKETKIKQSIRLDKLAAGVTLTQIEKDEATEAYEIAEYELLVIEDKKKAIDKLKKLSTKDDIKNFDVTKENWSVKTIKVKKVTSV